MTAPESASPVDKVKALIRALSDSDRQELDARLRDESIQEYYYQRSKEKADYQRSKEEAEQRRPWNLEVEPIKVWCDESRWYLIEFEPGASGDDVCIDVTQYEGAGRRRDHRDP